MEDITIQRKTGKNLRTVMSGLLVKDYYEAIKELVSNSYDEDAEIVNLTYDSLENKLVIEDDGNGISESGLEDFYRLGDSVKVDAPISPDGRKRIGKFGIATVLLEFLAGSYTLETWQNGQKITLDEDFSHKSEEGLEYKVEQIGGNSSGTRITLRNLKFSEGPQFRLGWLKRKLSWELPYKPDFKIYLNDEELLRKNDAPAAEFKYEDELPNAGLVKAVFYYFQKKPGVSGIYVYVNERSVGDPSYFDLHKIRRNLVDRVLGLVDADGLQDHISFDRSRFKEDNPAFNEVRSWVYSKLREVSKSVRIKSEQETADKLRTILPQSIEALKKTLATTQKPDSQLRREQRLQPSYKTQITESRRQLEVSGFHFVDRGKDDSMASIDKDKGELLFNLNHPFYEAASMGNPSSIQHHLLIATAYTKAEQRFVSERGIEAADFLKRRTELFGEYCKRVFSGDSVVDMLSRTSPIETEGFIPFRLYKQREIIDQQIPLPILRKLVRSGLVEPKGKEIYLGKELNEYLVMLEGYVPAMEIMEEYGMTLDVVRERRRQIRENINNLLVHYEGILPFIKNIGVDEPFFLVQEDKVDTFLGLYTKGAIRKPRKTMDIHLKRHPELLQQQFEEDRFVSLYELGKMTNTKLDDLLRIFSFSQIRGRSIGISTEDKTEKYSLRDFLRVNNEYMGGASG